MAKKETIKHQHKDGTKHSHKGGEKVHEHEKTVATVQVKPKIVEIKKPTNVYSADYKLIDDSIENIKKASRKVCTNDYATNNVYIILQTALKKVVLAEK